MTYMRCMIYLITVVGFKFKGHLRIICLLWKAYNVWMKGSYIYKLPQKPSIFGFG